MRAGIVLLLLENEDMALLSHGVGVQQLVSVWKTHLHDLASATDQ